MIAALQFGVKVIIAAAIVLVILVVIYAILYQMWKNYKINRYKCNQLKGPFTLKPIN